MLHSHRIMTSKFQVLSNNGLCQTNSQLTQAHSTKDGKVGGEQVVDVLLGEEFENNIKGEEEYGADDGEHIGVRAGKTVFLLGILFSFKAQMASKVDGHQGHCYQAAIRNEDGI